MKDALNIMVAPSKPFTYSDYSLETPYCIGLGRSNRLLLGKVIKAL